MKARMDFLVPVHMFKAAFLVEESKPGSRLSSIMKISLMRGYKGFRARGKTRKDGWALYTLESLFAVCRLIGASKFKGGVLPDANRHIEPSEGMRFDQFLALLLVNGNDVGRIATNSSTYYSLANAAYRCPVLRREGKFYVYRYGALAEVARKHGYNVPGIILDAGVIDYAGAEQSELPIVEQTEKPSQCGSTLLAKLLAATNETNRLLRELLKVWKGEEA